MNTIPLLLNPAAGSLHTSGLRAWLSAHEEEFRLIPTRSAEHLTETAARLAAEGEPIVAAAGGDGTLMCAAQGLMGSACALGILPSGTMNVFARELGIGSRNFDRALAAMRSGSPAQVDIFTVNDKRFLQMAGFGPDARIIQLITPGMKKRIGAAAHLLTGLKVMTEHLPAVTLHLPDGRTYRGKQIIFGNGKRYAGPGKLFRGAAYDDGLLDAAIFHQCLPGIIAESLCCMLLSGGTDRNTSFMTNVLQLSEGIIEADGGLPYQLDGDYVATLQPGEQAHITRLPQRLRVCVPDLPNAQ